VNEKLSRGQTAALRRRVTKLQAALQWSRSRHLSVPLAEYRRLQHQVEKELASLEAKFGSQDSGYQMASNQGSPGQPGGGKKSQAPPPIGFLDVQPKGPVGYQVGGKSLALGYLISPQVLKYLKEEMMEKPYPPWEMLSKKNKETPTNPSSESMPQPSAKPRMIFRPLDPRKGGSLLLPEGLDQSDMLKRILEASSNPNTTQPVEEIEFPGELEKWTDELPF